MRFALSIFFDIIALSIYNYKLFVPSPRSTRFIMAQSSGKKLIQIDVSADTVCPWCFLGKINLDKAMATAKDEFDFKVKWHPFFLNPAAPKEGVVKKEYYMKRFGPQSVAMEQRMAGMFRSHGLEYDILGLTGNTLDCHRLINYAGTQGGDNQHALVEELCLGYFTKGKYLGDMEFLVEAANKVGVEGAAEYLSDPNKGVKEVHADLEKYSKNISGVPYYVINGKRTLSGGQPPEVFVTAFQAAAKDN